MCKMQEKILNQDSPRSDLIYYHITESGKIVSCSASNKEEAEQYIYEKLVQLERHQ